MTVDPTSKLTWKRYYSEWAIEYDGDVITYGYRPMGVLRKATEHVTIGPKILDIGAGTSLWLVSRSELVKGERSTVVSLDISREMLERSRWRGAEPVQGDAESLPFAGGAFDTVLALELIEALPRPADFLAEARRVLRPGGSLVLTLELPGAENVGLPGREIPGGDIIRYSVDDIAGMIEDIGLKPVINFRTRGFHVYEIVVFCATAPV